MANENEEASTEIVGASSSVMLASAGGSDVEMQLAAAHRYPRDEEKFMKKVEEIVTRNEDTAAACSYELKRTDKEGKVKLIVGPSVRFAECLANFWKNLRVAARSDVKEKFCVGMGFAWDLETNFSQARERLGRITTSNGRRYGDDMIITATNAATSIAYREAILKTIPKVLWEPMWIASKEKVVSEQATREEMKKLREKAIEVFTTRGATVEQILAHLKIGTVEEIDRDDLLVLMALKARLKDGEKIATLFGSAEEPNPSDPIDKIVTDMSKREPKDTDGKTNNKTITPEEAAKAAGDTKAPVS